METAGYFARLHAGFAALGVPTLYADLEHHPFEYRDAPAATRLVSVGRLAGRRLREASTPHRRAFWKVASVASRAALLLRAVATCDVFIFGAGQTLFGLRELPLLRLIGKRVIIVFFGTDVRPSYFDGIEANAPGATPQRLAAQTRRKVETVRRVERHATAIVSHGPMSQLLTRSFAEWLRIGIPTLEREVEAPLAGRRLRVLHAPSHSGAKGTSSIRAIMGRLEGERLPLEYREVQGATNDAVQEAIAWCDVVIDQLYADTPMAVLAAEAAAAGRASVVGSVDWAGILEAVAGDAIPPSIRIEPDELEACIRRLAADPAPALELGQLAREFVRQRWQAEAVAGRFIALADGSAPADWFASPAPDRYVGGAGLSRERLAEVLGQMAAAGIDDLPGLRSPLAGLLP